ncbi:MAG: S53 family peptidase, partial [Candidatus Dormibacteraceae bacterium]
AGGVPTTAACLALYHRRCYQPAQIERAYGLLPLYARGLDGRGRTVVIVVSYGSPTIEHDLHVFDRTFGLPDPNLAVLQPAGPVPAYDAHDPNRLAAAAEASLDVEWAHAVAPGARIVLVETPTFESEGVAGFPDIVRAERYVIDHGIADVINESFGATEQTFPDVGALLGLRAAEKDARGHGVTIVAASGDQGATNLENDLKTLFPYRTTLWPASDPLVTAVGGTSLQLDGSGNRLAPDTVWHSPPEAGIASGGGGGVSSIFPRPGFQAGVRDVVGGHRGIPDVSLSAAWDGQVDVYCTSPGGPGGWTTLYGTSEAAPLFSGMVAIADQLAGRRLGLLGPTLYRLGAEHAPGIVDVTQGDNSTTALVPGRPPVTVPGYAAGPGYDLASGLGTVEASHLVPELAGVPSLS